MQTVWMLWQQLRQPLLRHMLAGGTSLTQAARISCVPTGVLLQGLEPQGFRWIAGKRAESYIGFP